MLSKTNRKLKTIAEIFNREVVKGSLGIELEVEGCDLPTKIKYYETHQDGSLRGESAEYVFDTPRYYRDAIKKIEYLKSELEKNSYINLSKRCSLHVHLNVSDLTGKQVEDIFLLYLLYEPVFHSFCSEPRQYNKFALTFQQASYSLKRIADCMLRLNYNKGFHSEGILRYSALNTECSISKQMSLEFRGLEATLDMEKIQDWLRAIVKLRSAVIKKINIFSYHLTDDGDLESLFMEVFGKKVYDKFWKQDSLSAIKENLAVFTQYVLYRLKGNNNA